MSAEPQQHLITAGTVGDCNAGAYPAKSSRREWLKLGLGALFGTTAGAAAATSGSTWLGARPLPIMPLYFNGLHAYAHISHPALVHQIVATANQLVHKPYKWSGGHRVLFDDGFDCSGSVSHVLFRNGLLRHSATSAQFASYGLPGAGRYVTLYVKPGSHVFMEVCGLRFDTTGRRAGEGPRWRPAQRSKSGFLARHPAYL